MSKESMITTIDNPFNPFEQYEDWQRFDEEKGYYTNNRLARILEANNINLFEDLSQLEIDKATEFAIDELVRLDFLDLYKKVTRETVTT